MKFVVQTLAIVLTAYLAELFLPWYSIAFVAFVCGYVLTSNANFLAGFIAIALLWLLKIWVIESGSSSDLADRVTLIFPLKQKMWLILVTAVLGGLVGGFAALTGALLKPKKRNSYYYK